MVDPVRASLSLFVLRLSGRLIDRIDAPIFILGQFVSFSLKHRRKSQHSKVEELFLYCPVCVGWRQILRTCLCVGAST